MLRAAASATGDTANPLLRAKELACHLDRHPQHLGNVLAPVLDLQSLGVVAAAVAGGAGRIHARQEEQLDEDEAFPFAVLATALRDVEREPSRVVAAGARPPCRGAEPAGGIEKPGVRRPI